MGVWEQPEQHHEPLMCGSSMPCNSSKNCAYVTTEKEMKMLSPHVCAGYIIICAVRSPAFPVTQVIIFPSWRIRNWDTIFSEISNVAAEGESPPGVTNWTEVKGVGAEGGASLWVVPSPSVAAVELRAVAAAVGAVLALSWEEALLISPSLSPPCTAPPWPIPVWSWVKYR